MNNPFPALIAYMVIQTVILFPLAALVVAGIVVLVGWGMALNELLNARSYYELPEVTYPE